MRRCLLPLGLALLLACLPALARSQAPDSTGMTAEEFEASLNYREGDIDLKEGLATLRLSPTFRYLDGDDAARVLVAWGNPPESSGGSLGMICPADRGVTADSAWAVIVTYAEDGYVSDKDAAKIDYDDLLKTMQKGVRERSAERVKQGYHGMELVGWAEPPHYDQGAHKIYWAKELRFEGSDASTLNYSIRALGRRGVLELNAVAAISQLPQVRTAMREVLPMLEFNEGHRYADFVKGQDKLAEYGLAALVTGGAVVAAKAGFFKGLLVALLALKKFIFIGLAGLGAWLRSLFVKKKVDGPIEERPSPGGTDA